MVIFRERFNAIKPGSIYHFLHLKMPVPSQEYDSCCPFVWCVLLFDFDIWLGNIRFEFSSEFSIFVILFSFSHFLTFLYLEYASLYSCQSLKLPTFNPVLIKLVSSDIQWCCCQTYYESFWYITFIDYLLPSWKLALLLLASWK